MSQPVVVSLSVAFVLLVAPVAQAHVVHIDPKVTGTELVVVAYFNNDLPADDAAVTLHDEAGNVVASGKTDDTGTWKSPKPPPGNYRLTVKAMANHSQTVPLEIAPPPAPEENSQPADGWKWVAGPLAALAGALAGVLVILWARRARRRTGTDRVHGTD